MHHVLLHCALIPQLGPRSVVRLLNQVGLDELSTIYHWSINDFEKRAGFSSATAQLVHTGLRDQTVLSKELEFIERYQIRWADWTDAAYPALLKMIHAPPLILYWRGAEPASCAPAVALVGSRQAGSYAQRAVDRLVPELVGAGWSVISGGARGADTMAHEATLRAGGRTAAVVGSGLLRPYPANNKKLFERIVGEGGSLISPFPLLMEALPGNFPARNRIIAGMGRATVVVQAAEKSGARITALYALEEGREVCAVPGDIFDPLSAGCHRLILEGATLVASGADVLRACGCEVAAQPIDRQKPLTAPEEQHDERDELLKLCLAPQSFDELLVGLSCSAGELRERLFDLQVGGRIEQDFAGKWSSL